MRGILDSGIKKLETLSEFIQNYKTKGLFKLLALWVPGFFHREVEHLFSQVLGFDGETLETPGLDTLRYKGSRIVGHRVQTYRGLKWSTKHCRPFGVVAV